MRSIKFSLPPWVAAGIITAAVAASGVAQQPVQAPVGTPPVMANVPQEDAYQLRALPPQEAAEEVESAPERYLELEALKKRGISTYGWFAAGIGANNWGSPFNGPITFNDRNWQGQLNQLYLVNEKVLTPRTAVSTGAVASTCSTAPTTSSPRPAASTATCSTSRTSTA